MSDPTAPFRPLAGFLNIFRRAHLRPLWSRVFFQEDRLIQGAELNDLDHLTRRRMQSIGDMIARDGDRVDGAAVLPDIQAGTLTLDAGRIYVQGEARDVGAAVMNGVPMTGEVTIGVRITTSAITHVDDPALLNLYSDPETQGEEGSVVVQVETLAWGWATATANDGQSGDLVPVYTMADGVVLDQTPPADYSVAAQAQQRFIANSLGPYVTEGFEVYALGQVDQSQVFSLTAGSAYVRGRDITRYQSARVTVLEDPDTGSVDAEPHAFEDGGTGTAEIAVRQTPIQAVSSVIVTKQTSDTLVRGSAGADPLGNTSVRSVLSVSQGATTYAAGTDYERDGDAIAWLAGGQAPATGESYEVAYRFLDSVPIDRVTDTSVRVSGGVTDEIVLVAYTYKLPRIDRLCLDETGDVVYVKGQSSALNAQPPVVTDDLVKLATVTNSWLDRPLIDMDLVRNIPFEVQWRYNRAVEDLQDLMGLERLRRDLDGREPVAKQGVFVDPFTDSRYRDAGMAQTGAVFDGGLELPITETLRDIDLDGPQTLAFTEQVLIAQELATGCMQINPYQVFVPPPARMTIDPPMDQWEERDTVWADSVTRRFGTGRRTTTTTTTQTVGTTQRAATFLRQIPVRFTIEEMGAGEILDRLTFDGLDVLPPGLPPADATGTLTGTFTIPAGVTTGTKEVAGEGRAGSRAAAEFVGEGTITTTTLRRVTTVRRTRPRRRQTNDGGEGWRPPDREPETGGESDPLAQTFMLTAGRMLTGIDVQFCAIGDRANPAFVELVTVENGIPTVNRIAQAEIDMQAVVINQWTSARFDVPIHVPPDQEFAFVFKTDDADHSLRIATRGDFDANEQQFVGAQPYIVGVLLSSSNARTWTAHQDSDLTMRIQAAVFDPVTRVVEMGTLDAVSQVSDLIVLAATDLPTAAARCVFEVELDDTSIYRVEAGQPLRLPFHYDGNLKLRAVLSGSPTISPILHPDILVVLGTLQAEGTYVCRAFPMGEAIRLTARMKTQLPAGATLTVEHDLADDAWLELTEGPSEPIELGWRERVFERAGITGTQGRLRLTLTGNPAARPVVSDLRTASI